MLEVYDLKKSFLGKSVINIADFHFSDTGVSLLVGKNGSGKSTLFNLLTGVLKPDSGEISLDGSAVGNIDYKRNLYYLPSEFYLPEYMSGKEYINFIASLYEETFVKTRVEKLCALLDFEQDINDLIEGYSYGMRQKISLIAAISANTKYLVADEIFNGLDFESSFVVENLLEWYGLKHGVLLVAHSMQTANRFKKRTILLEKGNLHNVGQVDDVAKLWLQDDYDKKMEIINDME